MFPSFKINEHMTEEERRRVRASSSVRATQSDETSLKSKPDVTLIKPDGDVTLMSVKEMETLMSEKDCDGLNYTQHTRNHRAFKKIRFLKSAAIETTPKTTTTHTDKTLI